MSVDKYKGHLDPLIRGLPLWVILAMGIGLWVGYTAPEIGKALDWGIPVGLFLMIYPAMTKLLGIAAAFWFPHASDRGAKERCRVV